MRKRRRRRYSRRRIWRRREVAEEEISARPYHGCAPAPLNAPRGFAHIAAHTLLEVEGDAVGLTLGQHRHLRGWVTIERTSGSSR